MMMMIEGGSLIMDEIINVGDILNAFLGDFLDTLPAATQVYIISSCTIFLFTLIFAGGMSAIFGCVSALTGLRKGGKQ